MTPIHPYVYELKFSLPHQPLYSTVSLFHITCITYIFHYPVQVHTCYHYQLQVGT